MQLDVDRSPPAKEMALIVQSELWSSHSRDVSLFCKT